MFHGAVEHPDDKQGQGVEPHEFVSGKEGAEDSGSDRCLETIDDWMLTCRHAFQLDKDLRKERKTIFVEILKPPAQVKCSSMSAGARCTSRCSCRVIRIPWPGEMGT